MASKIIPPKKIIEKIWRKSRAGERVGFSSGPVLAGRLNYARLLIKKANPPATDEEIFTFGVMLGAWMMMGIMDGSSVDE